MSDEFYPAIVDSNARRYLFVVLENGTKAFCLPNRITISPGCHQCEVGLPLGAPVQVRLGPNDKLRCAVPFKVIELRCNLDFDGVESGRVHTWHGNHGSVARDCGCHLFLTTTKLTNDDFMDLMRGDEVEFEVKRSPKKNWIGEIRQRKST